MTEYAWTSEIQQNGIASLTFDLPNEKVNTFNMQALLELEEKIDALKTNSSILLLRIKSKKPGIFIAGADLNAFVPAFEKPGAIEEIIATGSRVFRKLETLSFPTVAEIDGACLGGGLECALACTFRIASDNPKTLIGLPEVSLGIIPGWGGTQRLPRLIGLEQGVTMIASGRAVNGVKAFKSGLVDAIFAAEFFEDFASAFAVDLLNKSKRESLLKKRSQLSWRRFLMERTYIGPAFLFNQARKSVLEKTKGHYPAPIVAIDLIQKTYDLPLEQGLKEEKKTFVECVPTKFANAKHLIQLFFANEALKKNPSGVSAKSAVLVEQAGLIGAGTMGGGIAWLFCNAKIPVRMKDVAWSAINHGLLTVYQLFQKQVKERRLKKTEATLKFLKVSGTLDYTGFKATDFIVEAATEKLDIKKEIFRELEEIVSPKCVIASNTSSLTISAMSVGMKHPERVVGMHFFNPANKMPLVEIVRGPNTSEEALSSAFTLAKTLKKVPIVVGDCPGFLVNRIFMQSANEIMELLQQGISMQDLEDMMLSFGMPMSPFVLCDEVGNDVTYKVAQTLQEAYEERMKAAPLFKKLVDAHLTGKKVGKGFYLYQGKDKVINPEIEKILKEFPKKPLASFEKPIERVLFPMINEAAKCLEEKIADSPSTIDMALIYGIGFPPFRGGLLRYADEKGIPDIVKKMEAYENLYGPRFKPADLLKKEQAFYTKS